MANHPSGPSVQLRRLASELRSLRESAQLSRNEVMNRTGINDVTLYRIERGKTRPQQRTLSTLLDLYDTDEPTRERLTELATTTHFPGWIRPFRSVLGENLVIYMSFESQASAARNYETLCIPGLLQTPEYARAMIGSGLPLASHADVETRVRARLERQAVLAERVPPLRLWSIVDEAALRRQVGSAEVMAAQLHSLLRAIEQPEITLQVIPFEAGAYPSMVGPFVHLQFDGHPDTDIVSTETATAVMYVDSPDEVHEYTQIFDHLRAIAMSPGESSRFIAEILA
jgi:transcriptional regulator with XRE-family HTH domain